MDKKALEAFAKEAAKGIKSPEDLTEFSQMLKKITVEAALNAEMDEHLGYEKHQQSKSKNSRNGKSSKRIKTEDGEFELDTPRDRNGSFDPKLVKKHQSRFTSMDDKILWLYAQGMSTRDIVNAFEEWYGAEISPSLVSRVTNAVIDEIVEWQSRPLDALYPIVYLDCIVIKVRQDKRIINKSIFLALGINTDGQKELMGMWIAENEGAKFWLNVLTELNQRGVEDILIACVDGLKG
ncbi:MULTISPECIES: IS256 family transposase, partial [unclassified Vibrio]